MIWSFMWSEDWRARDQIKKASKGDRNLPLTIFSVCLEESGFESQISLLNPPENFNGKLKVPGKESKEVVITEVWGGANQGFGSCFSSRKKKSSIWIHSFSNGILLPKLFWPTVRKKSSTDCEKLLKFKAEGREFAREPKHFLKKTLQSSNLNSI